jgi:Fur family ferric uptake transcriptional regulator
MEEYKVIFDKFLRKNGLRLTSSRMSALEAVFATHDHFDVEALYDTMRRHGLRASRATLYRTIHLLVASGLVRQVPIQGETTRYEHIWGHPRHLHLVCTECGALLEDELGAAEQALLETGRRHGWRVTEIAVSLRGVCPKCDKEVNDVRA